MSRPCPGHCCPRGRGRAAMWRADQRALCPVPGMSPRGGLSGRRRAVGQKGQGVIPAFAASGARLPGRPEFGSPCPGLHRRSWRRLYGAGPDRFRRPSPQARRGRASWTGRPARAIVQIWERKLIDLIDPAVRQFSVRHLAAGICSRSVFLLLRVSWGCPGSGCAAASFGLDLMDSSRQRSMPGHGGGPGPGHPGEGMISS